VALAPNKESRQARRLGALELRLSGLPIRRIAERQGVSVSTSHNDLDKILSDLSDQHSAGAAQLRAVQSARYESLLWPIWDKAKGGDLAAIDRCVSLLGRIDRINGLDDGKSLAVWIQSQTEVRIGTGEDVPAERLKEYADVIRQLVAAQDVPAEADTLAEPSNGHRESLTV